MFKLNLFLGDRLVTLEIAKVQLDKISKLFTLSIINEINLANILKSISFIIKIKSGLSILTYSLSCVDKIAILNRKRNELQS